MWWRGQNSPEVLVQKWWNTSPLDEDAKRQRMENMTGTILKEETPPARQEGQINIPAAPVHQAPEDVSTGQAGDAVLSLTWNTSPSLLSMYRHIGHYMWLFSLKCVINVAKMWIQLMSWGRGATTCLPSPNPSSPSSLSSSSSPLFFFLSLLFLSLLFLFLFLSIVFLLPSLFLLPSPFLPFLLFLSLLPLPPLSPPPPPLKQNCWTPETQIELQLRRSSEPNQTAPTDEPH